MKQTEAQIIINALNRAGLLQAMEGQSAVWADALDGVRYDDAVDAAKTFTRTRTSAERWVTPGDIREEVQAVRRRRATRYAGWRAHITPPDTEDYQLEIEWTRAMERYLGDGLDPEQADAQARTDLGFDPPEQIEAARPITALVESVTHNMPRVPRKGNAA